jgi:hypothetical protein
VHVRDGYARSGSLTKDLIHHCAAAPLSAFDLISNGHAQNACSLRSTDCTCCKWTFLDHRQNSQASAPDLHFTPRIKGTYLILTTACTLNYSATQPPPNMAGLGVNFSNCAGTSMAALGSLVPYLRDVCLEAIAAGCAALSGGAAGIYL